MFAMGKHQGHAGLAVTFAAANTDGSKFLNPTDERTFIYVKNTNGATRTVTLETQRTSVSLPGLGAVPLADIAIVVAATTGEAIIGPIAPSQFNDSDGYAHITFSAVSGVTVAVVHMGRVPG